MAEQVLDVQSRSVWQVVASYGIGSWIVLQVADTLSSLIGLPLWFGQALLAVIVAGFVLLVATGVVQGRAGTANTGGLAGLFTWRNMVRAGVAAIAVVIVATSVYLGMRTIGIGPVGTLQARGVLEDQERLILADFEDRTDQEGLGETVTTLLRIDLAQSRAFSVMEPVQLSPILRRMQRDPEESLTYEVALEAAQREGIKAIVAGELVQAGPSVVVSARIVAAASGEVLVAVRETASDLSELPESVDRLSAQLRERVGESLRAIQGDQPLEQVTTASFAALEKYAQSDRADDLGDRQRAILLIEEAIGADSTFAMAHRKLGILLQNAGVEEERRNRAFTRAYELRDRLTDRERWLAEAAYLDYVAGDGPGSTTRYESLLESYPNDPTALNNLGLDYRAAGREEAAAELYLRSIRNGGAPATTYTNAIPTLYFLGDTAEARSLLEELEQAYPRNPAVGQSRLSLLSAVHDYEGAEAGARQLLELTRGAPDEGASLINLGQTLFAQGQVEEALDLFIEGVSLLAEMGMSPGITAGAGAALLAGGVDLYFAQRPEDAVRTMDREYAAHRVVEDPVVDRQDLQFALMYALAGRADRARARLDAYVADGGTTEDPRWTQAQAAIAMHEGRVDEALDGYREARAAAGGCPLCGLADLGMAFDRVAQPDSAIHYLETYMTTLDMNRLQNSDNFMFWWVVPRLAALQAEAGDAERARRLYTLFLNATRRADDSLMERREQIQAELDALGS